MNYERLSMKVRQYQHHISQYNQSISTQCHFHSTQYNIPNTNSNRPDENKRNEQMKLTHTSTINVTLIDKLLQVDAPG